MYSRDTPCTIRLQSHTMTLKDSENGNKSKKREEWGCGGGFDVGLLSLE